MLVRLRFCAGGMLFLLAAAACAPASSNVAAPSLPKELLYLRTDEGLAAIDASSGRPAFQVPGGVASLTWAHMVGTTGMGHSTLLREVDQTTGKELWNSQLQGRLEARAVSSRGLVALSRPRAEGATRYLPAGSARTTIVIATDNDEVGRYHLKGNFEPEAFSTNDQELFMIEYIPALHPERYRVRRLLLESGKVKPIGASKLSAPGQMRGTGRAQVPSPHGDQLYTLYTEQGPNYVHGPTEETKRKGKVHSFVHVLDLSAGWAHCIDLPFPFGSKDATSHAIAISSNGGDLFVVDPSTSMVAHVKPSRFGVTDVGKLDLDQDAEAFAAVGTDGTLFVASGSELLSVDPDTLAENDRWEAPGAITGLAASPENDMLYVGVGRGVQIRDLDGRVVKSVPAGGSAPIVHVLGA